MSEVFSPVCIKCNWHKNEDDFYFDRRRGYRYRTCKACVAEGRRTERAKDPEKYNAWHRSYRAANRDKLLAIAKRGRERRPDAAAQAMARSRRKDPARALLNQARARAKKYGIEFAITRSDVTIPDVCPVLNIPFGPNTGRGAGNHRDSMSLDRIDPAKGYIPGNVQVISGKANAMKSNASADDLINFANWIRRTIK